MEKFVNYCCSVPLTAGVTQEQVKQTLFPFSLRDDAAEWLRDLDMEAHGVTDWNSLALAFYKRYFPPQKTNALRSQITSFKQGLDEDFNEAWVRFKRLVRSVPHHGFQTLFLCNQFYNGLYDDHRALLESAVNGRFQDNTNDTNARKIINEIATHIAEYGNPRGRKRGGLDSAIATQLNALIVEIAELKTAQSLGNRQTVNALVQREVPCERCGAHGHVAAGCMSTLEQVHAYQSFKQGTPYSNFFAERKQNVYQPTPPPANPYIIPQNRGNQPQGNFIRPPLQQFQQMQPPLQASNSDMSDIKAMLQQQMAASQKQEALIAQLLAHNKVLDTQIAQLSSHNTSRQPGALPSKPDKPCETVNAIHLRSGLTYEGPEMPRVNNKVIIEDLDVDAEDECADETAEIAEKKASITNGGKSKAAEPPITIKLPFPARQLNTKIEQQFGKFFKVVKDLQVTVPFTELITQIPSYVKFMKEILSRKRNFDEVETIAFTAECSALLQNKSPPKLADPESDRVADSPTVESCFDVAITPPPHTGSKMEDQTVVSLSPGHDKLSYQEDSGGGLDALGVNSKAKDVDY
ncbi:uncharacterized protein LOC141595327 [Silene latifolia]|uniref:uncharacterized protein LOC141595327 n=1 Tax=Silene latifolia TaxID=37657 RepID=UPI003D7823BF